MDTVPEQTAEQRAQEQPVNQPVAQPPTENLSRRTLLVLVLAFCIIALVSTLAMMYQFTAARGTPSIIINNGPSSAHAGFTIGHPDPAPSADATGFAAFTIRAPDEPVNDNPARR
jgi:hypothetical protein